MEPKIVNRPAFTVAGMKYRGTLDGEALKQLWNAFGPRMGELKHILNPEVSYGVMANYDEATQEFDYIAACEVNNTADLPEDMVTVEIPEQSYAVFTSTLPEVGKVYEYAYGTWLPQSGYQHAFTPELEEYGAAFDPTDPASKLSIYVPLRPVEAAAQA